MTNHIHMIISISGERGFYRQYELSRKLSSERQEQSPCPTIGNIICSLKSITTKKANKQHNTSGRKIWQFRFHDHIIRNEQEYQKISHYIDTNPQTWENDCFYGIVKNIEKGI